MGYDLHIIRKKDYTDFETESDISLEEWLAYVAGDKELKLTNGHQSGIPGDDTWYESPGFCEWIGYSGTEDHLPWLEYGYGSIRAKNPEECTIRKMVDISKVLNAKVTGDSDEFYDYEYFTNGGKPYFLDETEGEPENNLKQEETKVEKRSWWKFW